ncbi:MAG: hypothetical protein JO118_13740, partial [Acetobacteraceae bacterium]|nr:hypothetical protein [Acetobacteraceae bacterium]
MPDLPTPPRSLADVLHRLQGHPGLPDTRRRDLASAVRRVAALLGAPPEDLPAALGALRPRLNRVLPAAHGLSLKTWHNVRSNLAAAIRATVPPGSR